MAEFISQGIICSDGFSGDLTPTLLCSRQIRHTSLCCYKAKQNQIYLTRDVIEASSCAFPPER